MKKSGTETEALARHPCPCPPASWCHGCSFRPIVRCSSDLDADSGQACRGQGPTADSTWRCGGPDHVATWHISCHTSDHQWWLQEGLIRNSTTRTLWEQRLRNSCETGRGSPPHLSKRHCTIVRGECRLCRHLWLYLRDCPQRGATWQEARHPRAFCEWKISGTSERRGWGTLHGYLAYHPCLIKKDALKMTSKWSLDSRLRERKPHVTNRSHHLGARLPSQGHTARMALQGGTCRYWKPVSGLHGAWTSGRRAASLPSPAAISRGPGPLQLFL